jgi:hypothetical protein
LVAGGMLKQLHGKLNACGCDVSGEDLRLSQCRFFVFLVPNSPARNVFISHIEPERANLEAHRPVGN